MSIAGTTHVFSALTKNSVAMPDQRLSRLIAKSDKNGKYASEHLTQSLAVSIPKILDSAIAESINSLYPHISRMLSDVQDEIIRDIRITTGASGVNESDITVARCIQWMEDEGTGGRVTKEFLAKWFSESYSDAAAEFICTMNKWIPADSEADEIELSEEQMKVVEQKVAVLRDLFSGWSGGKYAPNMPQCRGMIKFGEFLGELADERMAGYIGKAQKQLKKLEEEYSSDALGL